MTKETLLHATDLYTTIQKIEQLLTILEKNSIEEVKVRGFDGSPAQSRKPESAPPFLQISGKNWNA